MTDPRYPVGRFSWDGKMTPERRQHAIGDIEAAPAALRKAVEGLTEARLDTPYREGGWTVRQVAHHLADSHINSYVRFRLGLTETEPAVKPYDEKAWAELSDSRTAPVAPSLGIFEALHARWVPLLRALPPDAFARTIQHPEMGVLSLDWIVAHYAWHGRHHTAHITELRKRKGW